MRLLAWLAVASLATVSVAIARQAGNGSMVYEPLFQPHSNSTPVFQAESLLKYLPHANHALRKRASGDSPAGVCAPGQPCINGACCSKTGVCSYAPSSCAPENCISNCNATAPCGQYAKQGQGSCPLNVCCSQYGFCGSTDDFCGTGCQAGYGGCGPPPTPACGGSSANIRTIGYYESWASTRKCDIRQPEDIDVTGLTHLNFAFAFFDPKSLQITPMDINSGTLYSRFTALKNRKPSLQTWISIGGWSFNDDTNSPNTRTAFSDMVSSPGSRATFIKSLVNFMVTYGFDGVDLDWEYPAADDRGGVSADFANYVSLLQDMRAAFGATYGISATIPSSFWYLQHFDVKRMQQYLDWFNLMSYDIHGTWDSSNRFTGPFIRPHTNLTEISDGLSLLWRAGVDPSKVVLGLGWYGRSFTLSDPACNTPNGVCRFTSGANPGDCTNSAGTLSNAEISRIIASTGAKPVFDQQAGVKWITYNTNQWVSYDDGESMKLKTNLANSLCLSGTMIWAVDQDTSNGDSMNDLLGIGTANGVTLAQAQSYKTQLNNADLQNAIAASCYWSFCGEQCTSSYFDATYAKGQVAGIQRNSICSGDAVQTLCCAPGTTLGTCRWDGWRGVGMPCSTVCQDSNATIVARNSNSYQIAIGKAIDNTCFGGFQAFCCSGFKPSQKTNVGNLLLYGQGIFSNTKRDLEVFDKRGKGSDAAKGLTVGICTAVIGSMILAAPFSFGISLLGIPAEVAACAAAGIVIAAIGFSSTAGGGGQRNPQAPLPVATPTTGVPTTVTQKTGLRSSYGQWPILDFGTVSQSSGCDCGVTYTCKYGLGWDEVCDNQRWAIDKLLNGLTTFHLLDSGRAPNRRSANWPKSRASAYRTLLQGERTPREARCELDEFPMGNLVESGNNNPQACRLVNGPANGAQGNDFGMWKLAQWKPCSIFRSKVCQKGSPPATWKFGLLNGNRGSGSGRRFISAYGFDSQTANSLCFASYTYTDSKNTVQNTMVEDHGFRVLPDDPMFGQSYNFPRQDYKNNPAPKDSSRIRPTSVNSAAFLKRELYQNFMGLGKNSTRSGDGTCTRVGGPGTLARYEHEEGDDGDDSDLGAYHLEDLMGNVMAPEECDFVFDERIAATIPLQPFHDSATKAVQWGVVPTDPARTPNATLVNSTPRRTIEDWFPVETGE